MATISDDDMALIDNMFCRDIRALAELGATEEADKRRFLRQRVLEKLSPTKEA